jgi:hypothetical protein
MANAKKKTKNKSGNIYSMSSPNIQRIESASGTVRYRVRVGFAGREISETATTLKAARQIKARLTA